MIKKFLLLLLPLSEHTVLLKAALYSENSQIRSTWNKEANIHIKIMGIVNSLHSSDLHLALKTPTTTIILNGSSVSTPINSNA